MKFLSIVLVMVTLAASSLYLRLFAGTEQQRALQRPRVSRAQAQTPTQTQTPQAPAVSPLPQPGAAQPVTAVSFDGKEFISAFNAAADRTRLVLVFSPT
ncbi:MAG TPA: hypothetical protein VGL91_13585 [Acidobacteriota bacterium]|jgi:hypothetical protein